MYDATNRLLIRQALYYCSMSAQEKSRPSILSSSRHKRIPIYVMMPVDSFCIDGSGIPKIRRLIALKVSLKALKLAGVL